MTDDGCCVIIYICPSIDLIMQFIVNRKLIFELIAIIPPLRLPRRTKALLKYPAIGSAPRNDAESTAS